MSNGKPRRRSIFSGLLFILIGSVLLLAQLNPDIRFWRWFSDFWPVILILWGLAKLFDYFMARHTGDTPPRSLTGGEVFLLILLVLFGLGVTGFLKVNENHPEVGEFLGGWGEEFSFNEEVKSTEPVKPGSLIRVNNYRGSVTIHPEEAAEIRVVAKKTLRTWDDEGAESIAKAVTVKITAVPGGFEVKPELKDQGYRRVRVDMEIHVPKQVSLEVGTDRGAIQIAGITGNVSIDSYRGDVEIRSVTGDVRAEMKGGGGDARIQEVKGGVKVSGRGSEIEIADVGGDAVVQGEFYGPIRAKNVAKEFHFVSQRSNLTISQLPGRVEIGSGQTEIYDTPGSVSFTTREKDIVLENVGGRVRIENRRGNVDVRMRQAPKEEIDISNESGSVELALPGSSTFEITATSRQGEVESDFEGPDLKTTQDDRTSTLQGKVGSRGPKVQLRTTYGAVRLRKVG